MTNRDKAWAGAISLAAAITVFWFGTTWAGAPSRLAFVIAALLGILGFALLILAEGDERHFCSQCGKKLDTWTVYERHPATVRRITWRACPEWHDGLSGIRAADLKDTYGVSLAYHDRRNLYEVTKPAFDPRTGRPN